MEREMSMSTRILAAGVLLVAPAIVPAWALDVPARTDRYVNDYAQVLDDADEAQIERFLAALDQATTNQIVVVTWPSLEGSTAEALTLKFAEAWKPGQAARDNGVVVGVYPNDHAARIEVGYGLEGAIPDAVAATILREEMLPAFKAGHWAQGVAAGVQALAKAAKGEYDAPAGRTAAKLPKALVFLILFGIFGLVLYLRATGVGYTGYGPSGRYRRGGWGGPWGGGGGGWGGGGLGGGGGFSGGGGGFGGGGASGRW
jgi:uncharacterized protein